MTPEERSKLATAFGIPHDYTDDTWPFFTDLWARIKYWTFRGARLKADIKMERRAQTPAQLAKGETSAVYTRTESWTTVPAVELQKAGYKKVDGLHDSLAWWGVPVYLRISGGATFDITATDPKTGQFLYSQDTAATLHDVMTSRATENFIKGMGKTQLSTMDLQKLGMIAIVGAGAVFGLYMLGII